MVLQKAPKIDIDLTKCVTPLDCRKCLEICGQAVFQVEAARFVRLKENDPKEPGTYVLKATFRYACTGCNECIEVCPQDAIKIAFP